MIKPFPIPELSENYFISDEGVAYSNKKRGNNQISQSTSELHPLTPFTNKKGYYIIQTRHEKRNYRLLLHRLVAQAFISNPDNLPEVNHKFGIKSDNRASELEWMTHKQNQKHAIDNGLNTMPHKPGSSNGASKLTETRVLEIREKHKKGYKLKQLAIEYDVSSVLISRIVRRLQWTHI